MALRIVALRCIVLYGVLWHCVELVYVALFSFILGIGICVGICVDVRI